MKLLSLYIDKWYIVGAVSIDGIPRPISLPNHEDRIWLYFYEDVASDEISYGKEFQNRYRNNENHYYGDVFSLITKSTVKYIMFKRPQPIIGIFKSSKMFDDIRRAVEEEGDIETYVSFSKDISSAARHLFLKELENEHFVVRQNVARIEHLALEYAEKKNKIDGDGYYLVLNACNENLHYSIYQRTDGMIVRESEDTLSGMGTDVRRRALIEHVVDSINSKEYFLKTAVERESEYLRMALYVDDWLVKLSNVRSNIPIQLNGVTFARDPYKEYSVPVRKMKIDDRTEKMVKGIVGVLVKFVKDSGIPHEQIKAIVFLGNTFTNSQFKKELCNHYNLSSQQLLSFTDSDLPEIVNSYSFMDCSMFSTVQNEQRANAEAELRRIKQLEEEADAAKKAQEEADAAAAIEREASETERKFKDAMEKGYEAERERDYTSMTDYFDIALQLCPDSEEAKSKKEDALRKKAEATVMLNNFKDKIKEAKSAFDSGEWETARQKAEEAISYMPDSIEAKKIKDDSARYIKRAKDLELYLVRSDMFFAQKAYKEALQELDKAKLLDLEDERIEERSTKIAREQKKVSSRIAALTKQMDSAIKQMEFSKALECCNILIEIDFANSRKWSAKLGEINIQMQKTKEETKRYKSLVEQIDSAILAERWKDVASLCQEALKIKNDDAIREKLSKAEQKIEKGEEERKLNEDIVKIKDMVLDGEFKSAKAKLRTIESLLEETQKKYLRKLIFDKEDELEKAQRAKRRQETEVDFSDFPTSEKDKNTDFDWDFMTPTTKKESKTSGHSAKTKEDNNSFFDDSDDVSAKNRNKAKKASKISNDDFNF